MLWNFLKKQYIAPYQNLSREIYIIFAARIISCLGGFIQPLLTLILTQKLGYSAAAAGGFSAFIILTRAPSLIIGGKLADWIGRKKVLVFCQIAGAFFYLLCGLFPNQILMLPCIIIAADFYVAAAPAYESMTADYSTEKTRTASFSLIYLGVNIGVAVSSIFAGLLFQNHLRLMFFLDAATTLFAAMLITFFIKEADWQKTSDQFSQEVPSESPGFFSLFRLIPVLLLAILFSFIYEFTYSQWGFLLPLQLGNYYGEGGAFRFSILTTLNASVVVLFTPVLTGLTRRRRPLYMVALSGAVFGISYMMFAVGHSMSIFLLAGTIFTVAEILNSIHMRPYLANRTPPQYLGRVNSLSMFVQGAGGALGPLIIGKIVEPIGFLLTWLFQVGCILVGAGGMWALSKKDKKLAHEVDT
ncbi:MAG: Multidrug resistance protein MdtG [Oscillospiraceae bacterium]|jgi:MFS family permease